MSVGMKAVIRISGGIGNQFFQIGFGDFLAETFYSNVTYDISFFSSTPAGTTPRVFQGESIYPQGVYGNHGLFRIEMMRDKVNNLPIPRVLKRISWMMILLKRLLVNRQLIQFHFNQTYMMSFFGKHFTHVFIGDWQDSGFITKNFVDIVNSQMSVHSKISDVNQLQKYLAVHVRRGDYLDSNSIHQVLDSSYYDQAIDTLVKENDSLQIIVFSDDENGALNLLKKHGEIVLASSLTKDDLAQIYLMSKMKYLVIANSSYSLMAALLRDRSNSVIAPKVWFASGESIKSPSIPTNWKII
jgi:hypothetical protein